MKKPLALALCLATAIAWAAEKPKVELRAGVAAVAITPYGPNPDWDGTVTPSGVWGERFADTNHNGRWDPGEPFEDDPVNTALDASSRDKYDGIYLAGFGNDRLAMGKHDDLWARALVLECGTRKIAIVALDVIGYYANANYYGLREIRKLLDPRLGLQEILISSTHDHEAPDTIGLWGTNPLSDGKYPRYLRFVDREIAKAVAQAAQSAVPVRMKLGQTDPRSSPVLAGLQTRTDSRPPQFFDDELRVMQFVETDGAMPDKTVATVINWNTHPESMGDENTVFTSDFPHTVRQAVEKKYGGTAVYISGDLGAVEIVGDDGRGARTHFDGKDFPIKPGDSKGSYTFARTEAIGRDVARAVVDALEHAEWSAVSGIEIRKAELQAPMDNVAYTLLTQKSVLDTLPESHAGETAEISAWVYAITLGDAEIITTPGELFPEVFYGVEKYRRRDCPAADTHRPPEPGVRERMTKKYKFVLGLTPDEFGYIVPGYDFHRGEFKPESGWAQAKDACAGVTTHYHETNSVSSELAPAWACAAAELLDGKKPKGCR